jgi:hypothetical protein
MTTFSPTPEQAKDIGAEDAHELMRSNFLPVILDRADAPAILRRIASGDELAIDYVPDALTFEAALIAAKRTVIVAASLHDDEASRDLHNVLGLALTAALNREAPERQAELAERVASGAAFVVRLRVLAGTECLVLMLAYGGRIVWRVERAVPFDDAHRLSGPTLH